MLDPYQLTLHSLTLRQMASAAQLADVTGQPVADVETGLQRALADGTALGAGDAYMIGPSGRALLDAAYPTAFAGTRADSRAAAAMEVFEDGVNKRVLKVTTDWQTVVVGGERVPNDHGDADYDAKIIDRLGRIHDKLPALLAPLCAADPMVDRFVDRLGTALTRAEGGETDYVSGVRVDSFHTVWFQMHEHLLRLTGRTRPE